MKLSALQGISILLIAYVVMNCTKNEYLYYELASQPAPPAVEYAGCYVDVPSRVLPVFLIQTGATVESCVAAAKASGFKYAGVEYGGQCFAGDVLPLQTASNCNTACSSDAQEICGGTWAINVYY